MLQIQNINWQDVLNFLIAMGEAVCDAAQTILREQPVAERARVAGRSGSDVIYQIDRDIEDIIISALRQQAERFGGVVLVAEGIGETEVTTFPDDIESEAAALRVIVDPLDGTRGLMYEKRSAFFLAGAARNKGEQTRLSDIEAAVMVEVPTTRMYLSDTLYALKGGGVGGITRNLLDGSRAAFTPTPSTATTIEGGFAQISRFFPPGKDLLAQLEEELLQTLFPNAPPGHILTFEDQYISTGGQLYELLTGKDRFTADLRASLYRRLEREGKRVGHICHPYDLAAHLIGVEAGLIITGADDQPLDAPMNTTHPCDWMGYANGRIHAQVAPVMRELMRKHGLLPVNA